MSFTIVRTNGTVLTVIPDGDLNTTSTPLFLPGRNYPGYGAVIDTNFVRALENFAFTVPPSNALQGQLWYNTNLGSEGLYVCPIDGETNPANWVKLLLANDPNSDIFARSLTLTDDLYANNAYISNKVEANLVDTDYLTVNIQANIANANVTGLTQVANLNTNKITTGSNTIPGNITGAWSLNGSLTSNGNVTSLGVISGNYRYANGQLINFDQAAGSNSQVQYNLNGNLAASSKLTFNDSGALLNVDGSIKSINFETNGGSFAGNAAGLTNIPAANIVGTLTSAVQTNITQLGVLSTLTVTNTINTANISVANNVSANRLTGTLTTAAQPNITSVGTLSSLSVTGAVNASTVSGTLIGDGGNVSNIRGANVVGEVSSAAVANSVSVSNVSGIGNVALLNINNNPSTVLFGNGVFAPLPVPPPQYGDSNVVTLLSAFGSNTISTTGNVNAGGISAASVGATTLTGTLTTSIQPNITSIGTLTSLAVNGNINSLNVIGSHIGDGSQLNNINAANVIGKVLAAVTADDANYAAFAGNVINSSQPNITTVGTLNSLTVSGNLSAATATITGNTNFSQGTQQVRDVIGQVALTPSGITGVVNVDLIGPPTKYYTSNSTGNFILNFRGNSSVSASSYLSTGRTVTTTVLVTQGSNSYYPTGFTIDGTAATVLWLDGKAPSAGNPNCINSYTFNIIKISSSAYTVFGAVATYSASAPLPTSSTRTCIAVIDECSVNPSTISADWTIFRTTWPQRPFYLLQPGGPSQGPLNQPASFTADPLANGPITVNRDNGQPSQASDWYTICNIDKLPNGSNFALWIDNSGSMTTATVQASLDLLNAKIALRNITYSLQTDGGENWVNPFNKGL